MNPAQPTYLADAYRFLWPEEGIDIVVDSPREERSDLHAEVSISITRPFAQLLREGKFNLSSTRTRSEWIKALSDRQPEFDWYAAIEQICTLSRRRWREGSPFIDLAGVEVSDDDAYLLPPYVIDGPVASGIFADGGTGKSLLALTMALSVATGEVLLNSQPSRCSPVLFLDWEWDETAHAERLQALALGYGIDIPAEMIWYRHEIASILEGARAIRRFVAEHSIGLVFVDSLGFARGGEPESAELTIKSFSAMRSFGVPVVFVDHIAKHSLDRTHSFGSVYTRNSARLMWRLDAEVEENPKRLGLVNTKWNRRYQRPRGLLLTTETDEGDRLISARFDDCEPPLQSIRTTGLKQAIIALLKQNGEGLTVRDMRGILEVEGMKVSENVLSVTLSRKGNRNLFQPQGGRWFLLETQRTES